MKTFNSFLQEDNSYNFSLNIPGDKDSIDTSVEKTNDGLFILSQKQGSKRDSIILSPKQIKMLNTHSSKI